VAQLLDVAVFDRLRAGRWWRAPLVSSTVGSAVDTALFFTLAFAPAFAFLGDDAAWAQAEVALLGVGAPTALWISLMAGDFGVKMALALIALLPFRLAIALVPRRAA